ncbi:MAG TPA: ferritin-like domain-containing protein [Nocardioides sp.]
MTTEALQTTLAAEHAAVWLYGLLGGRTSASGEPELHAALTSAYVAHRARRDTLTGLLLDDGADPVAAAASYTAPVPLESADDVRVAAADAETAAAATYAFLVASTEDERRRTAIGALRDAAVRALGFGSAPSDLPGTD